MNYALLFHAIFFMVFKTNFSHEKPKHELQRNFQLLQLQNLLYNCRSGVCFLRASIVLQGLKYTWTQTSCLHVRLRVKVYPNNIPKILIVG